MMLLWKIILGLLSILIPMIFMIGKWYVRHRLVYKTRRYVPQIAFADVSLDGEVPRYEHNMEWLNNIVIFILDQYWNSQTEEDIVLFLNTIISGSIIDIKGIQEVKVKGLDLKSFRPGIASICSRRTTPTRLVVDLIIQLVGTFGVEVAVRAAGVKTNASVRLRDTLIPFRLVLDFANTRGGDGSKKGNKGAVVPSLLAVPSEDGNKLTLLACLPLVTGYIPLPISYDLKLKALAPGVGTILEQVVKTAVGTIEHFVLTMKCDGRVAMSAIKTPITRAANTTGKQPETIKIKIQDNEGVEKSNTYTFKMEKGIPQELKNLDDTELLELVEANKRSLARSQKAKRRRRLQGVQAALTDNPGIRGVKMVGDKTWGGVTKVGHGIGRVVGLGNKSNDSETPIDNGSTDAGERGLTRNNENIKGNELGDDSDEEAGLSPVHRTKNPFKKIKNHHKNKKELSE